MCRVYHATNTQEPDYDLHCLGQLRHVTPQLPVTPRQRLQKLSRDVQVKDGRHANGSKEANENGLVDLLDLRYLLVDGENPGESSEEQYQDAKGHQAVKRDHVVREESVPGAHGAVPHEDGHVEEHIDGGLKGIVECFEAEPVIPCESVASDEAGENTLDVAYQPSSFRIMTKRLWVCYDG